MQPSETCRICPDPEAVESGAEFLRQKAALVGRYAESKLGQAMGRRALECPMADGPADEDARVLEEDRVVLLMGVCDRIVALVESTIDQVGQVDCGPQPPVCARSLFLAGIAPQIAGLVGQLTDPPADTMGES